MFDIDSLSELVDIDPNFSTFTQTFSNLFQFDPNIPHHEIVDEEWKRHWNINNILSSIKGNLISDGFITPNSIRTKMTNVLSHRSFPELRNFYQWRWVLEQLVVASSRPKGVSNKYIELNSFVKVHNDRTKNPLFSYQIPDYLTLVCGSNLFYVYDHVSDQTWSTTREHLL